MYTELVMIIMGISLVLYLILGGADFGAGILEIFLGDKANNTVSKAIAPVWEANHMWLIIAVVILFNGFPEAYKILSTNLHIPVLIFLIALVLRGSAFTFRHYDAYRDSSQGVYSTLFRYSSLLAVFSLGLIISAFYGGTIPVDHTGHFADIYIYPWFNSFGIANGLFLLSLSSYIASIFLLGEVKHPASYTLIKNFFKVLLVSSVISGMAIFAASYAKDLSFHHNFINSKLSILAGAMATLMIPYIYNLIQNNKIWSLRIAVGFQISLIMAGWFVIQWPMLIVFSDGSSLTMTEAQSPYATMRILFWALAIGVLVIFPGLYILFKLFKHE